MNIESLRSSPFALMLAPEEVFRALQQSEALNRLQSRICRPLDKAVPTSIGNLIEADAVIDALPDESAPAAEDEGNTLN